MTTGCMSDPICGQKNGSAGLITVIRLLVANNLLFTRNVKSCRVVCECICSAVVAGGVKLPNRNCMIRAQADFHCGQQIILFGGNTLGNF